MLGQLRVVSGTEMKVNQMIEGGWRDWFRSNIPQITDDRNVFGRLIVVAVLEHAVVGAGVPGGCVTEIRQ